MAKFSPFWAGLRKAGTRPPPKIGFTDSSDPRVLQAARQLADEKLIHPVLVGSASDVNAAARAAGLAPFSSDQILSVATDEDRSAVARALMDADRRHELELSAARTLADDPLYQGVARLAQGAVAGLISGSTRPTGDVVKAALHVIGPRKGVKLVTGHFLIESDRLVTADGTPFLFADCAVIPEPSPMALAAVAEAGAEAYRAFTSKTPRVALLSFSTRGSAQHEKVENIRKSLSIIRKRNPSFIVDGEIQADAALDAGVAAIKRAADSPLEGKTNVFIFPNLESGNIGYKLVQRFSDCRVAGPLLWGLARPMSDLSRGCTVQDVIDTALCVRTMIQGSY